MKSIALLITGILSSSLAGCGVVPLATPFKIVDDTVLPAENSQKLLVVITQTSVRDERGKQKQFNGYVKNIERSLNEQHGLYGYALREDLLGNRAWKMTVWYDEKSMYKSKISSPHREAIASAGELVTTATFVRTERPETDILPSWDEALHLLETEGRSYRF